MSQINTAFQETQTFKKSVLKVVLLGSSLLFFYVYLSQEYFNSPISDSPSNPDGLIAGGVLLFVLFVVFHFASFKIRIDEKAIRFKFSPFHLTWRNYDVQEIKDVNIREFSPEKEFGGRGLRYSFKQKSWMYIITGQHCIEIEKREGGKTLLGINNPEEAEKAISQFQSR